MKLTVALATYNRPEFLKLAMEAILNQTYKNFEFVILNNGSTQETDDVIQSFKDPRIKHIRNEINNREFLNYPFFNIQSEFLIITHDDDIMENNFLEKEITVIDSNPNIGLVATNTSIIDINGKTIKNKTFNIKKKQIWNHKEFIKIYLTKGNIIPCPTVMMRTSIIMHEGIKYNINAGPMADLYLLFQFNLTNFSICLIDEPLYKYRIHPNQDSELNRIRMEKIVIPQIIDLLFKTEDINLIKYYKQSSKAQIAYLLYYKLLTKKMTFKTFKDEHRLLYIDESFYNKYYFIWFSKSILRAIKNLLI